MSDAPQPPALPPPAKKIPISYTNIDTDFDDGEDTAGVLEGYVALPGNGGFWKRQQKGSEHA